MSSFCAFGGNTPLFMDGVYSSGVNISVNSVQDQEPSSSLGYPLLVARINLKLRVGFRCVWNPQDMRFWRFPCLGSTERFTVLTICLGQTLVEPPREGPSPVRDTSNKGWPLKALEVSVCFLAGSKGILHWSRNPQAWQCEKYKGGWVHSKGQRPKLTPRT